MSFNPVNNKRKRRLRQHSRGKEIIAAELLARKINLLLKRWKLFELSGQGPIFVTGDADFSYHAKTSGTLQTRRRKFALYLWPEMP